MDKTLYTFCEVYVNDMQYLNQNIFFYIALKWRQLQCTVKLGLLLHAVSTQQDLRDIFTQISCRLTDTVHIILSLSHRISALLFIGHFSF